MKRIYVLLLLGAAIINQILSAGDGMQEKFFNKQNINIEVLIPNIPEKEQIIDLYKRLLYVYFRSDRSTEAFFNDEPVSHVSLKPQTISSLFSSKAFPEGCPNQKTVTLFRSTTQDPIAQNMKLIFQMIKKDLEKQ